MIIDIKFATETQRHWNLLKNSDSEFLMLLCASVPLWLVINKAGTLW